MRTLAFASFLLVLVAAAHAGEPPEQNLVEQALRSPPATGLLVKFVFDGSQSQAQGIEPGDVLVSYAGKPVASLEALTKLKEANKDSKAPLPCMLQRGKEEVAVELKPGPLGLSLAPVEKGKPAKPLPKATLKTLDLSKLATRPREVWYRFTLDGKTQVGFEHGVLRRSPDKPPLLILRHEVGFDGGKRWGQNHQAVDVQVRRGEHGLVPWLTRYENLLNGWVGEGARFEAKGEAPSWAVVWPHVGGKPQTRKVALPQDLPIYPTYLVAALVEQLPRKVGTCIHYRPLNEGMGTVGLASALFIAGEEQIQHDGKQVATWRVELRELGGTTNSTWWVDGAGRALRIDYGGARAFLSTREAALAGLPEGIRPGGPAKKPSDKR
jgi:hypothetical protein